MYNEKGKQHNVPHIHAEYQEHKAALDFNGNVLEGELPQSKLKLLIAWIEIHREDLEANWKLLFEGDGYFKIDPLK